MEHESGDESGGNFPFPAPVHVSDEIAGLLAGYALDALSDEEKDYVEQHLPDRPQWRLELSGYQSVTNVLPYASPQQQVPVRARAAILARIDALATEAQEVELARKQRRHLVPARLRRWREHKPQIAWIAAVPATTLAVVLIFVSILMQDRISEQQAELAAYQQEQERVNDVLLADNSGQQVVELIQSSTAPLARGRLFIDRIENTAMLIVRDMPRPADGESYIVWMLIGAHQDEYASMGVLSVDDLGRGQMILEPPDDFDRYPTVRITLEGSDDPDDPSGPDVLTGGIERLISR